MFEAQVTQTPDAVAVVFGKQQFTYRQLNQRANQLAHYLRDRGVGSDVLVGVYIDRSLDMVVGLLGVLKAGGAYVPLDPAYPADRVAFILQDTQVPVILTQAQFTGSLPAHEAQVIYLDSDWPIIAQSSQETPECEAIASNLMYAIYTSGSTGQPKGVMITHTGICNQLHWRQTTFPLTETDRVLQTISFSFDPSVWQIFWPLSFGAQLVLAQPGGHQDSAYLVETIAQQQITVIALVPAMLRLLLEEKGLDHCHCLKHVFCGGEALPLDLQERFFARLNLDQVLHNVYGPTEASIDATFWTCQRGTHFPIAPIGRPIANTQAYILDQQLHPVPIGEPGELHIGGAGLARGYLNRPELTREKFIPNPYSDRVGDRLYKTGDLVRYLPDGTIEFLGRIDHQVKVRGFRIELGEIEAALSQSPAVAQTVVMAREDHPGDKRLVAYVVPSQEHAPSANELRSLLKDSLPDYMIPAAFVMLETLPLNSNGKVDRRALPAPEQERLDLDDFVAPQTSLERELTQIWEQVLSIHPIGVKDNFFELGGNSLLAVRLLAQVDEKFGRKLPLSTFFQASTIEQLSRILQEDEQSTPWKALVAIQPNGTKPPLFCVHARNGNVLSYYHLAHYLGNDQPVYGLQLQDLEDELLPYLSVEEMAAGYLKEIQSLQPSGPYFLCGYSFGGLVAYEIARYLHAQGETVALLALLDTHNRPAGWFEPLPLSVRVSHRLKKWSRLELKDQVAYVQQKLVRKLYADHLPTPPLLAVDTIRAVCDRAVRAYSPRSYPGHAVLFRATQQPDHSLRAVRIDSKLGWEKLIAGGVEVQDIACNHFDMLREPYARVLAEKLRVCLDLAQALALRNSSSTLSSVPLSPSK
ncbi:amino acid adenylation domain-containing protein [Oculatella sp. LEGE 06141]|nr:amino acid adenylation domain-containing protein [Oculatella sp. LEGE 06141]